VPRRPSAADEYSELRPVRIRISDPSLREELSVHYARSGFAVRPVSDRELDVERTDAPDEEQARREIETHLLVWELLHPDVPGEIVD
jgi:hypothetical protein